ncbi:MAG TPA: hypothetical protein VFE86_04490 [Ilumatobacteraceae bacterium]|nr:hypothetical protein [Ilumatobacteraceae bacterium]
MTKPATTRIAAAMADAMLDAPVAGRNAVDGAVAGGVSLAGSSLAELLVHHNGRRAAFFGIGGERHDATTRAGTERNLSIGDCRVSIGIGCWVG